MEDNIVLFRESSHYRANFFRHLHLHYVSDLKAGKDQIKMLQVTKIKYHFSFKYSFICMYVFQAIKSLNRMRQLKISYTKLQKKFCTVLEFFYVLWWKIFRLRAVSLKHSLQCMCRKHFKKINLIYLNLNSSFLSTIHQKSHLSHWDRRHVHISLISDVRGFQCKDW